MDTANRTGAVAAAFGLDGNNLKVVANGAGGRLVDFDGFVLPPAWPADAISGALMTIGNTSVVWRQGPLSGTAHPKSTIAVCACHFNCTIDGQDQMVDVLRVFYQNMGESIETRTFYKGAWSEASVIIEGDVYVGTVMSVQVDSHGENVYLFVQSDSGVVVNYTIDVYGKASLWAQVTQESIPLGTVFTALFNKGDQGSRVYLCLEDSKIVEYVTPKADERSKTYIKTSRVDQSWLSKLVEGGFKITWMSSVMLSSPFVVFSGRNVYSIAADDLSGQTTGSDDLKIPMDNVLANSGIAFAVRRTDGPDGSWKDVSRLFIDTSGQLYVSIMTYDTKEWTDPKAIPIPSANQLFTLPTPVLEPATNGGNAGGTEFGSVVLPSSGNNGSVPTTNPSTTSPSPTTSSLTNGAKNGTVAAPTAPLTNGSNVMPSTHPATNGNATQPQPLAPSPPVNPGVTSSNGNPSSPTVIPSTTPTAPATPAASFPDKICYDLPQPARSQAPIKTSSDGKDILLGVFAAESKLWTSAKNGLPVILGYYFMDGNKIQKDKVRTLVKEWEKYADVIFREYNHEAGTEIRIMFDPDKGSWSFVGRDCRDIAKDKPTMNLGWINDKTKDISTSERADILHEFGHVLGLLHEHQSPARGGVAIDRKKAIETFRQSGLGWTPEMIQSQILRVYQDCEISNFSELDIKSIMHYPLSKSVTGLPADTTQNSELSDFDKAYMVINYPRTFPHPNAPEWTLDYALQKARVPLETRQTICKFAPRDQAPDVRKVREYFSNWVKETRLVERGPMNAIPPTINLPAHALEPIAQPSAGTDVSKSFADLLYDKIDGIFRPSSDQYIALQLPTRYLDKNSFGFKTAGIYSNFTKPVVVKEAEFRLTDELFDVGKFISAPNGKSLSLVYEQVLNNLVPRYQADGLRAQRERLRDWLMEEVNVGGMSLPSVINDPTESGNGPAFAFGPTGRSTESGIYGLNTFHSLLMPPQHSAGVGPVTPLPPTQPQPQPQHSLGNRPTVVPQTMSRIEFSQSLMFGYLKERMNWELLRDNMITEAMNKAGTENLEKVTRTLAHITSVQEAKLASKFGDVVVRGHVHTVKEYLGYLDVKSTAESLQSAKDSLRESAMSSVYSSRVIYPVLMQPVDWFESLQSSFKPEDLTDSVDSVRFKLNAKAQQLDVLNSQLSTLVFATEGNVNELKAKANEAAEKRDKAQGELTKNYLASTITAAKMYLEHATGAGAVKYAAKLSPEAPEDIKSLFLNNLPKISEQLNAISTANTDVLQTNRALTGTLAALEKAKATDTKAQQALLERQISTCRADIVDLEGRYDAAISASLKKKSQEEEGKFKDTIDTIGLPPSGDGRWQEIWFDSEVSNETSDSSKHANASNSATQVNLWLGSNQTTSSDAEGASTSSSKSERVKVSVGLRVTLVTVDRSGWFQPQFLDLSDAFMRASKGMKWSAWLPGVTTAAAAKDYIKEHGGFEQSFFPAYPVGYIVAKDIVVKIHKSSAASESESRSMTSNFDASGGCLCFSYSHSSHASNESSHVHTEAKSDGFVLRIPGPQVLGYVMQLTPNDQTGEYKAEEVPTPYFVPVSQEEKNSPSDPPRMLDPNATLRPLDDNEGFNNAEVNQNLSNVLGLLKDPKTLAKVQELLKQG